MIIDSIQQNNIQTIGDIKEFKTSIDPKNLNIITTLLSSNLYSNPEQSFIREIVSNAWDSHVEANTTNIPVIIKFNHLQNDWEISIRDFGTGLSPERFKNVFCNIGSSTKRDSNEYIGGFGLGRFSALACSNTVYVTSYYNGIAYYYIMVKSGNAITNNLILQKETTEKNGVEVTIKNIKGIYSYMKALSSLIFFPNVYVDGIETKINDVKIKRFNNFAAASIEVNSKFLLGNVLYPCNDEFVNVENKDFIHNIHRSGIVISFNVGELNVTPNRESIIYDNDTIKKINDKIKAAHEELNALVEKKFPKNYNNLYDYYEVISSIYKYEPLSNTYHKFNIRIENTGYEFKFDYSEITFKNREINSNLNDYIKWFFHSRLINIKGVFFNNRFYQGKIPYKAEQCLLNSFKKILILKNDVRFTTYVKEWLQENYNSYIILTDFTKEEFIKYIHGSIYKHISQTELDPLVDDMYEYIKSTAKIIDLNTDSSFQKYVTESKAQKIPPVKRIVDFIVYQQSGSSYRSEFRFLTLESCIKWIKEFKKGVVLLNMKDSTEFYYMARIKNYVLLRARKEIVDAIRNLNLKCIINKKDLFKDKVFIQYKSMLQVFPKSENFPLNWELKFVLKTIPYAQRDKFNKLILFYNKVNNSDIFYKKLILDNCKGIDEYTINLSNQLNHYVTLYRSFCENNHIEYNPLITESLEDLITMAIIKSKLYRVDYLRYKAIKNNNLIKILCKK